MSHAKYMQKLYTKLRKAAREAEPTPPAPSSAPFACLVCGDRVTNPEEALCDPCLQGVVARMVSGQNTAVNNQPTP